VVLSSARILPANGSQRQWITIYVADRVVEDGDDPVDLMVAE
jgi:hypothetical protein